MDRKTDTAPPPGAASEPDHEARVRRSEKLVTYGAVGAVIAAALVAVIMHDRSERQDDAGPVQATPVQSGATTAGREDAAPQTPRRDG